MKITAIKLLKEWDGVSIGVLSGMEIQVEEFFKKGLSSLDILGYNGVMKEFFNSRLKKNRLYQPDNLIESNFKKITVKCGRKKISFKNGFIIYETLYSLIEFLSTKFVPVNGELLDKIVRENIGKDGKVNTSNLEKAVIEYMDYNERPKRFRRFRIIGSGSEVLPVLNIGHIHNLSDSIYRTVHTKEGKFICFADDDAPLLITRPVICQHRGYSLPRLSFFFEESRGYREHRNRYGEDTMETLSLFFDGSGYRFIPDFASLSPSIKDDFEKNGKAYMGCNFDLFPALHLSPRCVVRIPPANEIEAFISKTKDVAPAEAKSEHLRKPAFVFDSQRPICLAGDEPVVDDVRDVLFVLSHLVNEMFVPSETPRPFPVDKIPLNESFLILAVPGD